jgi:hypothetical protein
MVKWGMMRDPLARVSPETYLKVQRPGFRLCFVSYIRQTYNTVKSKRKKPYLLLDQGDCRNPFQCGSLGCAHRAASGPIGPDNIMLFGPVPPVENSSPQSCGPIGQAPYGALLIWAC